MNSSNWQKSHVECNSANLFNTLNYYNRENYDSLSGMINMLLTLKMLNDTVTNISMNANAVLILLKITVIKRIRISYTKATNYLAFVINYFIHLN